MFIKYLLPLLTSKKIRSINAILIILLSISVFLSCKKDPSLIGLDIQPGSDKLKVNFIDTISVNAYTMLYDTIITKNELMALIGSYYDPILGLINSGFYSQIRLSTQNVNFRSAIKLVDVYLSLDYEGSYGDTATPQHIKIYELSKSLHADSNYYGNQNMDSYYNVQDEIGDFTYYPSTITNTLQIPLIQSFGNKILQANPSNLTNNETFVQFIKGIYISAVSSSSTGSINYFSLNSNTTKLVLKYQDTLTVNGKLDTLDRTYELLINTSCVRANVFNNQYLASILTVINDTINQDSVIYLQPTGQLRALIKFPYLTNLKSLGKIVINKAELIFKIANTDVAQFSPPEQLGLRRISKQYGEELILDEAYYRDLTHFDGAYRSTTKTYHLNITRYIQQLVDGELTNDGLYLFAGRKVNVFSNKIGVIPNKTACNRVVLTSGKNSNPIKILITYTQLQNN